jgi:hypothetical protein
MINILISIYFIFGIGYAIGTREGGATVAGAFIALVLWPLWLGYDFGRNAGG